MYLITSGSLVTLKTRCSAFRCRLY